MITSRFWPPTAPQLRCLTCPLCSAQPADALSDSASAQLSGTFMAQPLVLLYMAVHIIQGDLHRIEVLWGRAHQGTSQFHCAVGRQRSGLRRTACTQAGSGSCPHFLPYRQACMQGPCNSQSVKRITLRQAMQVLFSPALCAPLRFWLLTCAAPRQQQAGCLRTAEQDGARGGCAQECTSKQAAHQRDNACHTAVACGTQVEAPGVVDAQQVGIVVAEGVWPRRQRRGPCVLQRLRTTSARELAVWQLPAGSMHALAEFFSTHQTWPQACALHGFLAP